MNHKGLAIVYNDFMRELGGGERSTLAYATALKQLGYQTKVLSVNPIPDREKLIEHFGVEFADVEICCVTCASAMAELRAPELAVFVNHTFMSSIPNPAPIGIYAQMFPVRTLTLQVNAAEIKALSTYDWILCNSAFTRRYTEARWPVSTAIDVLLPPLGTAHASLARSLLADLPHKTRQIVHVGRFNPTAHCKNQHLVLETFLEAANQSIELRNWRLVLMGTVTDDTFSQQYFDRCARIADGRAVLLPNVSSATLSRCLLESFGYVHATGAFLPSGMQPECCEHFGLSIVEAMAHGCIPVVYGRGGIWDFVGEKSGLLSYRTRAELTGAYRRLLELYSTGAGPLQTSNLRQAETLNLDDFRKKLGDFLLQARERSTHREELRHGNSGLLH